LLLRARHCKAQVLITNLQIHRSCPL
jgi:hypothetical protein